MNEFFYLHIILTVYFSLNTDRFIYIERNKYISCIAMAFINENNMQLKLLF